MFTFNLELQNLLTNNFELLCNENKFSSNYRLMLSRHPFFHISYCLISFSMESFQTFIVYLKYYSIYYRVFKNKQLFVYSRLIKPICLKSQTSFLIQSIPFIVNKKCSLAPGIHYNRVNYKRDRLYYLIVIETNTYGIVSMK
jgi:hypothetical protein